MKLTFKFILPGAAVLCGLFAACAPAALEPDARDAHWARGRWPGTTVADLRAGRELFLSKCGSCHGLPDPAIKGPEEWASVIGEMAPRARLSDPQRESVLRYLSAASARTSRPAERPPQGTAMETGPRRPSPTGVPSASGS